MKYKVGDEVKIVALQSRQHGDCKDVVGDVGKIVDIDLYDVLRLLVQIEDGGKWWWEESNLELVEDIKPNTSEVIETIKRETEMSVTKVETKTPKFKKGDIVVRTGFSYEDGRMVRGNHYTVHGCIGSSVYSEGVYDDGELDWFGVDNFDLVKSYEVKPSAKFKKGDKVKVVGETCARGVETGKVYTVKNPTSHDGWYDGKMNNHVSLEEADGTPNEDCLELYIEPRNYRNMKPTDLIKVSVDGFEDEIPLGELVNTKALLGGASITLEGKLFYMLESIFDKDKNLSCIYKLGSTREFQEQVFEKYFKDNTKEKANLKELISNKQNELKELQDKLNQLES